MSTTSLPSLRTALIFAAAMFLAASAGCNRRDTTTSLTPVLEPQTSGVSVRLQAVSAVSDDVAWVSGLEGTYARTTDGGATWAPGVVPGAESLQFRDVHAVDAHTAYLLSAGSGDASRIYKTTDGGQSWSLQFVNPDSAGFLDCFAFWDPETGVTYGDAVDGKLVLLRTEDGEHWTRVPNADLPPAQAGEGGFAASGTCVTTQGDALGWIGTGAADTARVLVTDDRGRTWTAHPTPVVAGSAAGITSVAFRDADHGVAVGGAIDKPDDWTLNVVLAEDGGRTWTPSGHPTFAGAIYGAAYVPGTGPPLVVAVGPAGAAYSSDDGRAWVSLDTLNYWGLDFASANAGWIVGPDGRITGVRFVR
jgi:photosystem II stability/assembly factor-like uncharacterized protein